MTAFLSDTPTYLRPSLFFLSFRCWGRKRATIARFVSRKHAALSTWLLMGSFWRVCVCVCGLHQFGNACFLHRFCSHFFFSSTRKKKGLGFVHQIDFMSCGIYGRDVSTMSVSFEGFVVEFLSSLQEVRLLGRRWLFWIKKKVDLSGRSVSLYCTRRFGS